MAAEFSPGETVQSTTSAGSANKSNVTKVNSDVDADDLGAVILPRKTSCWNSVTYFLAVTAVASVACLINILLWSAPLGLAATTMHWLIVDGYDWYMYPMGISMLLVGFLYVFDFFSPPHFVGNCMLWKGDYCFGRSILITAFILLVTSFFLMARDYPSIPIVITLLLEPAVVTIFRQLSRPLAFEINEEQAKKACVEKKMTMLRLMVMDEGDMLAFFKGSAAAFAVLAIASFAIFYASFPDAGSEAKSKLGEGIANLCWSTPLIAAIANLLFAISAALRVGLQKSYTYTNNIKAELVLDVQRSQMVRSMTNHKMLTLQKAMSKEALAEFDSERAKEQVQDKLIHQHAEHVKSLMMYVKIAGILFCVLAGLTYGIISFADLDQDMASLVMGLVGVFAILLSLFFYVSFKRVAQALGQWIRDLPAWKAAQNVRDNDWVKAFFTCLFLQLLPFVLIMSFLNQSTRKVRGVYTTIRALADVEKDMASTQSLQSNPSPSFAESVSPPKLHPGLSSPNLDKDADKYCLTPRVHFALVSVTSWSAYSMILKIKLFCVLFIGYYVVQPCANIVFAYLIDILSYLDFGFILILTFCIGVIAFLLPPVPGMTVYIFGGLIVSKQCPAEFGGFWGGAFWNILLCWCLKLVACAVQQKIIGENLGKTFFIRSLIGVHTMQVRCFEKILKKKGWTLGKVALLCGGPDWPVSVTAGVLKLSLVQCEIGTIPIIVFVIPCALTGSLYAPPKGANYDTLFRLMLFLSLAISGIMFAIIMWAVQHTLEENYYEVTKRLEEHVDLHYEDMKNEQIAAKATIPWAKVPAPLRWMHVGQAIVDILCCTTIYWRYSDLFGTFQVQESIDTLVIYGKGGIFNIYSVAILIVWCFTWILHIGFDTWKTAQTRQERAALCAELRKTEHEWKQKWVEEAREMEKKHVEEEERRKDGMNQFASRFGSTMAQVGTEATDRSGDGSKRLGSGWGSEVSIPTARATDSMVAERGSMAKATDSMVAEPGSMAKATDSMVAERGSMSPSALIESQFESTQEEQFQSSQSEYSYTFDV